MSGSLSIHDAIAIEIIHSISSPEYQGPPYHCTVFRIANVDGTSFDVNVFKAHPSSCGIPIEISKA